MQRDQSETGLFDARPDAVQEAQLPERRGHHALVRQTLDLMHTYDQGPQGKLFALGWFNVGDRLVSDGQVGGANSVVMLVPAKKVAIAVLMNMTSRGATAAGAAPSPG